MKIKALPGTVLVDDIQNGERIVGKIVLLNDNGKSDGIRPRWCRVYAVGEGVDRVEPGQWLLVRHGRWTRAFGVHDSASGETKQIWKIEWPDAALLVSDQPFGETFAGEHTVQGIDAAQLKR
jgi:hypothetical protein